MVTMAAVTPAIMLATQAPVGMAHEEHNSEIPGRTREAPLTNLLPAERKIGRITKVSKWRSASTEEGFDKTEVGGFCQGPDEGHRQDIRSRATC